MCGARTLSYHILGIAARLQQPILDVGYSSGSEDKAGRFLVTSDSRVVA